MRINVDYTVADAIVELIESEKYKDPLAFDNVMLELSNNKGMQQMLNFYQHTYDYETYKKVLFLALNHMPLEPEDEGLSMLYNLLKLINTDVIKLKNKLLLIKAFDFECIAESLNETLPDETELEIDLYFVFDGINGASIVGDHVMLVNTMLWPSDAKYLPVIRDVLSHEYHHIGMKYWLSKRKQFESVFESTQSFMAYFISSLVGEGLATLYFTSGDNLYPLALESHGEAIAENFKRSVNDRQTDSEALLKLFEQDLSDILSNEMNEEHLETLFSKYSYDPSGNEPLNKTIGYHMCQSVEKHLGRNAIFDVIKNPMLIFDYYNQANVTKNGFVFSEQLLGEFGV